MRDKLIFLTLLLHKSGSNVTRDLFGTFKVSVNQTVKFKIFVILYEAWIQISFTLRTIQI